MKSFQSDCICLSSDDDDEEVISPPSQKLSNNTPISSGMSGVSNNSGGKNQSPSLVTPRNRLLTMDENTRFGISPPQMNGILIESLITPETPHGRFVNTNSECVILSDDEDEGTMMYTSPPKQLQETNHFSNGNHTSTGTSSFSDFLSSPILTNFTQSKRTVTELFDNVLSDDESEEEKSSPPLTRSNIVTASPSYSPLEYNNINSIEASHSQFEISQSSPNSRLLHLNSDSHTQHSIESDLFFDSQHDASQSSQPLRTEIFTPVSFSDVKKKEFFKRATGGFKDEMVVVIDEELSKSVGGKSLITFIETNSVPKEQVITQKLPLAFSVQWKRRLPLDYSIFVLQKQKKNPNDYFQFDANDIDKKHVDFTVPYVVLRITGDMFTDIYLKSIEIESSIFEHYLEQAIKSLDVEFSESLSQNSIYYWNKRFKKQYIIIVLIEGLPEYLKKVAAEQYSNALNKKKNASNAPTKNTKVNADELEKYKLRALFKFNNVKIFETKNVEETAQYLDGFTKIISDAPYKKRTSNVDFTQIPSSGKNSADQWITSLIQIPKITDKAARAIAKKYKSFNRLMQGYNKCEDTTEKKELVKNVAFLDNPQKVLGKAISNALYEFYCINNDISFHFTQEDSTAFSECEEEASQHSQYSQHSQSNSQSFSQEQREPPKKKKKANNNRKDSTPVAYENEDERSLFEDDLF
ncbi:predicted protein [Naegleria gruberi]|uniref:Predicted protein n=1 Tax=Naegleria gruberi TaxID=5762 RepID=D2VC38_NAEGR|nr:uncharacterized protein NAEGRDRAFT_66435 [Naegleria gruberi]EFC45679.1 predicted protein [Naegleria gruberi]|eukprot:XP_002678423.1 predicted protein [Naegleria gruberi strain NEG-M]